MIQKSTFLKTLPQLKLRFRFVLNSFVTLVLILVVANFSSSLFNGVYCKNEAVANCLKVNSDSPCNQAIHYKFQLNDIPSSTEIEDLEDEYLDDDKNDDYAYKIAHQINKALPIVEFDKKISFKKDALFFRSSIPLFILYHSWKDYIA